MQKKLTNTNFTDGNNWTNIKDKIIKQMDIQLLKQIAINSKSKHANLNTLSFSNSS